MTKREQTEFITLCWQGNVDEVQKILDENSAALQDRDGSQTALHIVCRQLVHNFCEPSHFRYWRLLKVLLRSGIDVNAQDENGNTALQYLFASKLPHEWLLYEIELLLAAKASIESANKQGYSLAQNTFLHRNFTFDEKKQCFRLTKSMEKIEKKVTILKRN